MVQQAFNSQVPILREEPQIVKAGEIALNENLKEPFYLLSFGADILSGSTNEYHDDLTVSDVDILPHTIIEMNSIQKSPKAKKRSAVSFSSSLFFAIF